MIIHGDLKNNFFATLELISNLKGVSVGARFLAINVLQKHGDWKVNWAWFAKEFGVSVNTIKKWNNELCKAGVWEVETNSNLDNRTIWYFSFAQKFFSLLSIYLQRI